ncbi:MAG: class I SAM-dependent methyltransferase [Thermomicrobiales bacterium]|nr:class I SAM-dependent methyltransferase [Thermomicrobiales bacterium]
MVDARPTERFTSRVDAYVRYRPGYPAEIIDLLARETGLDRSWTIADIGSGPGNLARVFLDAGFVVRGVEPNAAMREAGDVLMRGYDTFQSFDGTAESTGLPDESVDLVTAGQAFHWFAPEETREEFRRILRSPGWVALVWNKRPDGRFHVLDAYSEMLQKYSTEYELVRLQDERGEREIATLFGAAGYQRFVLPNEQELDAEAFWGRLISSSYTPLPGEPGHEEIRQRSAEIFAEHAQDGVLRFPYETVIYVGQVRPE